MRFSKYQALGNDYIIVEQSEWGSRSDEAVRRLCDRHYGIGGDGVLVGEVTSIEGVFPLQIYNPDGSRAEKSGNGLRIFARYLWDRRRVDDKPFTLRPGGGPVRATVLDQGGRIRVEMGHVSFCSTDIPVTGPEREVLDEPIEVAGHRLRFSAATIGNPHCVVTGAPATEALARKIGPLLEAHSIFPNRANVQLMEVLDRNHVRLSIWERGAGYTLASGSSSCAAAAVAHRLGLCAAHVIVEMAGGTLDVELREDGMVVLTGQAEKVFDGVCDASATR